MVANLSLDGPHDDRLQRLRWNIEAELAGADTGLLRSHPVESCIQHLDRYERIRSYDYVPREVRSNSDQIARRLGPRIVDLYHRLLLISLIEGFRERLERYPVSRTILDLLLRQFDRVLSNIESFGTGFYSYENDLFLKDLGLCRLKLLPCGSEWIDVWSGVPRRTLFQGGGQQLVRGGLYLGSNVGGFKPLYESHWDRRLVREFSAPAYDACYLRIAELMLLHPEVKGMMGASWWFAPDIAEIAPEFRFLRGTPQENGARIFRVGPDAGALRDALAFSKRRSELYEAGRFVPCRYMLVWSRNDMLTWAGRVGAWQ